MDGASILFVSSMIIMLVSLISVSYKTGFVFFSIWALSNRSRPKFEVDKKRIGKFVLLTLVVFLLNCVYGILIIRDINEIEGILILSLFNTAFIVYALAYWFLFKEKKSKA